MPELTVVLPVHNGGDYLVRAIGSTLRALPRDGELLVVDDASTDGTPAVLERARAADRRVRILHRGASSGVADALNAGIAATDSRLLARMDADDVCLPTRFARQVHALRRLDFVFGSSLLIDGAGRLRGGSSPLPIMPRAARYHLLIGNFFSHPTMACRREAVVALGGYTRTVVEDFDLWLRAAAAGMRLAQSPVPAIAYRMHEAQVTHSWRVGEDDPVLDAAYRRLLPAALQDDTSLLRRAAATRIRVSGDDSRAWERLRVWLEGRARTLPAIDRAVLHRRIAQHAPRDPR